MRDSCEQGAQRGERRLRLGLEGVGLGDRRAVDLGLVADGAPDEIGLEADDGVAPAHGAALHRFQQEAHRPPGAQLQLGGDRRLEVGDEARPHDLRRRRRHSARRRSRAAASPPAGRAVDFVLRSSVLKAVPGRRAAIHSVSVPDPVACLNSSWLTCAPRRFCERDHVLAQHLVGKLVRELAWRWCRAAPWWARVPA